MDGKYTTKKDMFGKLSFFDEKGNRIGRESRGFGGMSIVVDDRGKKVADITFDGYGRRILKRKETGFPFDRQITLRDSRDPEDWEYCDRCDEYGCDEDCDL